MGKRHQLVALSFFKSSKVDYYLEESNIHFPCFFCNNETTMDANNTQWSCIHCKHDGTLITLIEHLECEDNQKPQNKIFNPKREKRILNEMIESLKRRVDTDIKNELNKIQEKIEALAVHYKKVEKVN